ncbi:S-layer homology domain-containing protein [Salibacterium sp. K-3]
MRKYIFSFSVLFLLMPLQANAKNNFNDVNESFWAEESILELSEEGVITGYSDDTFRPNDSISRAHAAVMVTRALGLNMETGASLPNEAGIADDYPYYNQIAAVYEAEVMTGGSEGFRPEEDLTRAQMAAILQRAFDLESGQASFEDIGEDYWAWNSIAAIAAAGITTGDEEGNFRPGEATTRAQLAVFLDNAMNLSSNGGGSNQEENIDNGDESDNEGHETPPSDNHYTLWETYDNSFLIEDPAADDMDTTTGLNNDQIVEKYGDWTADDFKQEFGVNKSFYLRDFNGEQRFYVSYATWDNYATYLDGWGDQTPYEYIDSLKNSQISGIYNMSKYPERLVFTLREQSILDDDYYEEFQDEILDTNAYYPPKGEEKIVSVFDNYNVMEKKVEDYSMPAMFKFMNFGNKKERTSGTATYEWLNEWNQVIHLEHGDYVQFDYIKEEFNLEKHYETIIENGIDYVAVSELADKGEVKIIRRAEYGRTDIQNFDN